MISTNIKILGIFSATDDNEGETDYGFKVQLLDDVSGFDLTQESQYIIPIFSKKKPNQPDLSQLDNIMKYLTFLIKKLVLIV